MEDLFCFAPAFEVDKLTSHQSNVGTETHATPMTCGGPETFSMGLHGGPVLLSCALLVSEDSLLWTSGARKRPAFVRLTRIKQLLSYDFV